MSDVFHRPWSKPLYVFRWGKGMKKSRNLQEKREKFIISPSFLGCARRRTGGFCLLGQREPRPYIAMLYASE